MQNVLVTGPQIHIRLDGRSIDLPLAELDIGSRSTDDQIRRAVADHLGRPVEKLAAFQVDRQGEEITLRPEAVFA